VVDVGVGERLELGGHFIRGGLLVGAEHRVRIKEIALELAEEQRLGEADVRAGDQLFHVLALFRDLLSGQSHLETPCGGRVERAVRLSAALRYSTRFRKAGLRPTVSGGGRRVEYAGLSDLSRSCTLATPRNNTDGPLGTSNELTPLPIDHARLRRAVREILIAVGEDPDREG